MSQFKHLYKLLISAWILIPGMIFAYDMPVGIPTPPLCIDEVAPSHPAAWPSNEVANYYYVDNTHPDATDSANTYGYPDKPRVSIPTTLSAGAVVEIQGGPYVAGQRTFVANGTSSNPVWIRGPSENNKTTLKLEAIVNGSYLFIENLRFDETGKTLNYRYRNTSIDHMCLRNSEFVGSGSNDGFNNVIGIYGTSGSRTTDIVIYNNVIHEFGDNSTAAPENDYHGILPGEYTDRVWVLANHVYNNGGDSIQVGQGHYSISQAPSHVYIGDNTFHNDKENGVDVKVATDVVISQNTIYGYQPSASSPGEAIVIHLDPEDVWVINNHIYDSAFGIVVTGSLNTKIIGNVIHDINHPSGSSWNASSPYSNGAAIHMRGGTSGSILNNTIYNNDTGIQLTQGSNYVVEGNIFAGRAEPNGYDIYVAGTSIGASTNIDYNLFDDPHIYWNGSHTLSSLQSTYSSCTHCPPASNPLFVNPAADNFTLLPNSPAIDKAMAPSSEYSNFRTLYGVNMNYDINNVPRPMSGAQEIGACEISGSAVYPPSPPVIVNSSQTP